MPHSDTRKILGELLVDTFKDILTTEENSVRNATEGNLSVTEIHTLEAIGIENPRKMSDVAASLRVTVSTLTTAVNRLEYKGYVKKVRLMSDRRVVNVELTPIGIAVVQAHLEFHARMIEAVIDQLNDSEIESFNKALTNLNEFFKDEAMNNK